MPDDLRSFLLQVEEFLPERLLTIERPISPRFEVTALLKRLEDLRKFPIVQFNNVADLKGEPGHRLVANLFAERSFCALALKIPPGAAESEEKIVQEFSDKARAPISPTKVPKAQAPVKQQIFRGDQVDLLDLPVVTHHDGDGGPYFTQPVISVDPDTGVHNVAFQRLMVRGRDETGIHMAPYHTFDNYRKYMERGRACPIAAVLGHHPALSLAATTKVPKEVSELAVAGSFLGEPLRLVESETWGKELLVPADAEIVLEGEIIPGTAETEGPFGEWTGYQGPAKKNPVVVFRAITCRRNPIMVTNFVGHRESYNLQGIAWEADILRRVRDAVPSVVAVHAPPSGCSGFHFYISIRKRVEGEAKTAAYAALGMGYPKLIVVVDDDVDVFNESQVLHAVATRCQASRDVEIVRGLKGSLLDPSMEHPTTHDAIIIDATVPTGRKFPPRLQAPADVVEKINIEEYCGPKLRLIPSG